MKKVQKNKGRHAAKSLLSLFLCLALAVLILPANIQAAESGDTEISEEASGGSDTEDTDSADAAESDSAEADTAETDAEGTDTESETDEEAAETDSAADSAEADAESEDETDQLLSSVLTEASASSWRYQNGYLILNASTDSDAGISLLSTYPYSTWKKSYGTSYLGIVKSSSTTTKVKVSGVARVGIDVSKWQGDINWAKVAAAGIDYAIIRCGYGSNYSSQDDAYFIQNVEGAIENGIEIGIYLYSYATTTSAAKSEANHVLRLLEEAGLDPYDLDLPIFLDMEDSTQAKCTKKTLGNIAETFCDMIEAEGYEAGIYANKYWWSTYLTDSRFSSEGWYKWVARYPTSTSVTSSGVSDTDIWQFTSSGTVSGISGSVDINFDYQGDGYYVNALSATLSSSLTSATLKWKKSSSADGYQIYRSVNGGSYTKVKTITKNTTLKWTDSSLSLGKVYRYKVRAYNVEEVETQVLKDTSSDTDDDSSGETEEYETVIEEVYTYGKFSNVEKLTTRPGKVTISSAAVTTSGYIQVKWKKKSNATGYVIYRSVNGGSYKKVKTITKNTTLKWTDTSVTAGKVYRYKIKSYKKSGSTTVLSTSYSSVKKIRAKPAKVTISSVKSTKSRSGTVKWKKVSGATGYQVAYRRKGSSKWYYVTVKTNSKTFTGLRVKNYYVKVRAYKTVSGTKYYGSWSSAKAMKVK